MTTTTASANSSTAIRPAILSRALLLRFVSVVAAAVGFYLPLAAVPMFAAEAGSGSAAGVANGALLVATVIGELATPRVIERVGYRWALAVGLILLGVPVLLLLVSASLSVIVLVGVLRGLGFALTVVAGGALTAILIPEERRGEGLAIVGLVGGIPALLALPMGVWMADRWGFAVVFAVTAIVPLIALATVPGLPRREPAGEPQHGVLSGLRNGALMRPATIFAASASAAGVVVTYLPLALSDGAAWLAPVALLVQPATSTLGRLVAGRLGDRRGQSRLLVPGMALAVVGMAAMSLTHVPVAVIFGAAAFGVGFGLLQNATLSLMYARVPAAAYATVSAVWNAAYDLGMAAGAIGVGLLIAGAGYSTAFLIVAVAMIPALVMAHREQPSAPVTLSPCQLASTVSA
jgi:predicted MFS family arabinose efflux permease